MSMTDDHRRRTRRIDHTHQHTDRPLGATGVYDRGPTEHAPESGPDPDEREPGPSSVPVPGREPDDADAGGRDATPRRRRDVQRPFDRGEGEGEGEGAGTGR